MLSLAQAKLFALSSQFCSPGTLSGYYSHVCVCVFIRVYKVALIVTLDHSRQKGGCLHDRVGSGDVGQFLLFVKPLYQASLTPHKSWQCPSLRQLGHLH